MGGSEKNTFNQSRLEARCGSSLGRLISVHLEKKNEDVAQWLMPGQGWKDVVLAWKG